ncbi:hypothetical protein ACFL0P_05285 [Candidatus Omnitrophota bacterium]
MDLLDFDTLRTMLLPHLLSLKNFHFSVANPLFWAVLIVLFLILLRFWQPKKSFSFCLTIGIILLATTKLENFIANMAAGSNATFDPFLIRVGCLFIISILLLCYALTGDL